MTEPSVNNAPASARDDGSPREQDGLPGGRPFLARLLPDSLPAPGANYAHAVLVEHPTRWLHTSGVVPVERDGTVPVGVAAQAQTVWATIRVLLDEAGLDVADVVSVTTYLAAAAQQQDPAALAAAMAVRDTALGGRRAASTLLVVAALARPEWLIEIAVVAAR